MATATATLSTEELIFNPFYRSTMHMGAATTKDKVIQILSSAPTLTAKQIHNRLTREHALSNTYQATHKALKQMMGEGVLLKTAAAYYLNPQWVENYKKQAEQLAERVKNKDLEFDISQMKEGESVHLSFDGIVPVGWFLINTIMNAPNPKHKPCLALWRFCYSVVGLPEKYITRLKDAGKMSAWHILIEEDSPVDRMFGETMLVYGVASVKYGVKCATSLSDKMISGDYVAEIIYPSHFRKLWWIQNHLPKKIVEFNIAKHIMLMREIAPKIEVILTFNSKLADEYRKEYHNKK